MKSVIFLSLFLLATQYACTAQPTPAKAGELTWHTDLAKARELSDVFDKAAFITWANKNVILLELDFPRRKKLPAELVQQNQGLQQAFQVRGYPTIWIFTISEDPATQNLNLNALGSLGYPSGSEIGKEEVKFLNDADLILANGKK